MIQAGLQKMLDDMIAGGQTAGAAVLLYRDGRELAYASAGVRDLDAPAPFDRRTVMRMYSMTKVVTAAAIMILWDRGMLTPESPVSDFLPEYAELQVCGQDGRLKKAETVLRVKHLLTMTSGIPYHWVDGPLGEHVRRQIEELNAHPELCRTTLDLAGQIARIPLQFEPGTGYLYGLSADVLGGIMVCLTGMELGDFLQQNLFDPLEMKDTAFRVLPHMAPRLARKYRLTQDGGLVPDDAYTGQPLFDRYDAIEMGGSGLFSTLDDFMKFGEMLRQGGLGIIREETLGEMTANQLPPAITDEYLRHNGGSGYGYLVSSLVDPALNAFGEGKGTFGWGGMAGTELRIDPVRGYTLVYGTQRIPGVSPTLLNALKEE